MHFLAKTDEEMLEEAIQMSLQSMPNDFSEELLSIPYRNDNLEDIISNDMILDLLSDISEYTLSIKGEITLSHDNQYLLLLIHGRRCHLNQYLNQFKDFLIETLKKTIFSQEIPISLLFLEKIQSHHHHVMFISYFSETYGVQVDLDVNQRVIHVKSEIHEIFHSGCQEMIKAIEIIEKGNENDLNMYLPLYRRRINIENIMKFLLKDNQSLYRYLCHESLDYHVQLYLNHQFIDLSSKESDNLEIVYARLQHIVMNFSEFEREIDERKRRNILHIHIDLSNILYGFQPQENHQKQLHPSLYDRINVRNLIETVLLLRTLGRGVCVGSFPSDRHLLWKLFKDNNFETNIIHNNRHQEEAVDDVIHAGIQEDIMKDYGKTPRTLAILTGDGNVNKGRTSFPSVIEAALLRGWYVELWTWKRQTKSLYQQFKKNYASHFKICYLDPHRDFMLSSSDSSLQTEAGNVAKMSGNSKSNEKLSNSGKLSKSKFSCRVCSLEYDTFIQLREHLKKEGHYTSKPDETSTSSSKIDPNIQTTTSTSSTSGPNKSYAASDDLMETVTCPISLELFEDPVMTPKTNITYSRASIVDWINKNGTDPVSDERLTVHDLIPNLMARNLVEVVKKQMK